MVLKWTGAFPFLYTSQESSPPSVATIQAYRGQVSLILMFFMVPVDEGNRSFVIAGNYLGSPAADAGDDEGSAFIQSNPDQ